MDWAVFWLTVGFSSVIGMIGLDFYGVGDPLKWWLHGYALAIFHVIGIIGFSGWLRGQGFWKSLRKFRF